MFRRVAHAVRLEATLTPRTYVSTGLEDAEVPLLGGDMTEGVVRVGRTVRRPVRPHTAAVHGLLRHLEAAGFDGAPRVLGIDAKVREVLTYLPGVVARRPLPAFVTADSTLAALARLQLRYHEAVAGFEPAPGAWWDGEVTRFVDGPVDIICHCDINLENVIFQPGPDGLRPYALIDFDLARPGTRLVDIIQTLRYWAPIADPADRDPALRDVDVAARIAIFCEAYGLSYTERARLVPVASQWLRRSRATIAQRARMRGGAWTRMVDVGVGERLLRSAVWLERNQPEIEARLCRPIGRGQPASPPSLARAAGHDRRARALLAWSWAVHSMISWRVGWIGEGLFCTPICSELSPASPVRPSVAEPLEPDDEHQIIRWVDQERDQPLEVWTEMEHAQRHRYVFSLVATTLILHRVDDDHRIHEGGQQRLHRRLQRGEFPFSGTV
jgi:hypothetical protein